MSWDIMRKNLHISGSSLPSLSLTLTMFLSMCNISQSTRLTDYKLRLTGGIHPWEGRPEIYTNGTWNTICQYHINETTAANLLCRELGFQGGLSVQSYIRNIEPTDGVFPARFICDPLSVDLSSCEVVFDELFSSCSHSTDLIVNCWNSEPLCGTFVSLRLAGGAGPHEGRVEAFYGGEWGTICDDYWDIYDAYVVCRQLGYPYALEATSLASFGPGAGTILMDDVKCHGLEENLGECQHGGFRSNNCFHPEDAGVVCSETPFQFSADFLQFERSRKFGWCRYGGVVKVKFDNIWWTICADGSFNLMDVETICTQMGYSTEGAVRFYDDALGYHQIRFGDLRCTGTEESLLKCPMREIFPTECHPARTAAVCCGDPVIENTVSHKEDLEVRLMGSSSLFEGRVEVRRQGENWATVCDDLWDLQDAEVVCRQLGFPGAKSAHNSAMFGPGSGTILLDDVECIGNETNIGHCKHKGFQNSDCNHKEDAGVSCLHYAETNFSNTPWEPNVHKPDNEVSFSSGAIIVIALVSSFGGILCLTFVSYLSCLVMDKCCCKHPQPSTTSNVRLRNDLSHWPNRYQDAFHLGQVIGDLDCPIEVMLPLDRPPAYETVAAEEQQPLAGTGENANGREGGGSSRPSTPPPSYEEAVVAT